MKDYFHSMPIKVQYETAYRAARVAFSDISTLDAEGKVAFIQGMTRIGIKADIAANAVTSLQIR